MILFNSIVYILWYVWAQCLCIAQTLKPNIRVLLSLSIGKAAKCCKSIFCRLKTVFFPSISKHGFYKKKSCSFKVEEVSYISFLFFSSVHTQEISQSHCSQGSLGLNYEDKGLSHSSFSRKYAFPTWQNTYRLFFWINLVCCFKYSWIRLKQANLCWLIMFVHRAGRARDAYEQSGRWTCQWRKEDTDTKKIMKSSFLPLASSPTWQTFWPPACCLALSLSFTLHSCLLLLSLCFLMKHADSTVLTVACQFSRSYTIQFSARPVLICFRRHSRGLLTWLVGLHIISKAQGTQLYFHSRCCKKHDLNI